MKPKIKHQQLLRALFLIFFLMVAPSLLAQSSSNFKLTNDVFSQTDGNSQSLHFNLQAALGQPSPIGDSNNSVFLFSAGFYGWRTPIPLHVFHFHAGWSWISFNIKPRDLALETILGRLEHLVILVNGAGQFYIPRTINSIGNLSVQHGYKVYFDAPESLELTGKWVAVTTPISLVAGWNFISYLATDEMDTEIALTGIISDLVIAKDDVGHFYVPGTVNTMAKMMPTKGYKIYMNNPATLVYPLVVAGPNGSAR